MLELVWLPLHIFVIQIFVTDIWVGEAALAGVGLSSVEGTAAARQDAALPWEHSHSSIDPSIHPSILPLLGQSFVFTNKNAINQDEVS